jgi:hypothetical protein
MRGLGTGQLCDAVGGVATTIHAPHHTPASLLHIGYTVDTLEETSTYFVLMGLWNFLVPH